MGEAVNMSQSVLGKNLWLNNNLLEATLRRHQDDESIFVKTFEVKKAITNRKQSYWCDVVRLGINFTNSSNVSRTRDFILKIAQYNPYMEESIEKYDPFKRELFFHLDVLPKIEELLLSVPDSAAFTDKAILIVNERPQPKYLMIEHHDEGFLKVDRRTGLDLDHLKVVFKSLAKLHAASAMLPEEALNSHQQPNISEYFKVFHSLFVNCLRSLVDDISSENEEEAKALARKLNAFERNMIEKCSDAFMLERDEFGVLCHGDLWLDNLLFKYDDQQRPVESKMVDFGLSYFGSPGIDLAYLLFTSSSSEVRDYELDVSLQFYHSCLHQNLIALGYRQPIPSLIQIHNSFMKCGVIGAVYSCLLLPMRFADRSLSDLSFLVQQTEEDLEIRRELFDNAALKERFRFLLNYFDRKGFLD